MVLLCALHPEGTSADEALRVEKGDEAPPASLGEATKAKLGKTSLRLGGARGLDAILWIAQELPKERPGTAKPSLRDRLNFAEIAPGSLVGVLQTSRSWSDYRGQVVPAGLYTLRYAIQPVMKDHRGVSPYRDFLFLVPAGSDRDPDAFLDQAVPMLLSREASGTRHPAVLALFPAPPGAQPGTTYLNSLGQPSVVIRAGATVMGLVLEGHGELEAL